MNKPASKIYRTTNWSSYNRALINRGNISIWLDPKTQWYAQSQGKQGRNQTYSDTAIQCCLMIKLLFRLSLRMVTGFVQSLIKLSGLDWTAPDYSTLCRRQKHIDIAISYQKSSDGLHLLVDSTGLKFLGEGEWKRQNHGAEYRRQWRKLHIAMDAKTLQIRAVHPLNEESRHYVDINLHVKTQGYSVGETVSVTIKYDDDDILFNEEKILNLTGTVNDNKEVVFEELFKNGTLNLK